MQSDLHSKIYQIFSQTLLRRTKVINNISSDELENYFILFLT